MTAHPTTLRRIALGISQRVVRWASPGCQEWAEGLEREVEFISSDWRALAWAIGSTCVLLDRREAPMASLTEARKAAKGYRASFGNRLKPAYPYLLWVLGGTFLWLFLPSRLGFIGSMSAMERAGGCLIGLSMLYYGFRSLTYRQRNMDEPADAYGWAIYYRCALQKDLDLLSGRLSVLNFALLILGASLIYGSNLIPFHGGIQIAAAISYMPGLLMQAGIFYASRRRLKYRIGNLDQLISAGVEGAGA